ncbi:hypothetical protein NPIL_181291, partial [Nephila pilipes]
MDCVSADNTNCYIKTEFRTMFFAVIVILSNWSRSTIARLLDVLVFELIQAYDSDFGKQRMWSMLGAVSGPPLAGYILYQMSSSTHDKSYSMAFVCSAIFTFLSAIFTFRTEEKSKLPATKMWKNGLKLIKNLEMSLFVVLLLIMGSSQGFQAVYVSWYLQDIGASDILIGIYNGMMALYALPFLHSSKWWIHKIGERNLFVLGLLAHAVYCFSISVLYQPWFALIILSLSVLYYHLFWVSVMYYVSEISPDGLQATLRSLAGTLLFNV